MRTLVLLLVIATLASGCLSGCLGTGTRSTATLATQPTGLVPDGADWGAVEGYVFGDDRLPISNVTVAAPEYGMTNTSDAFGYYYFLHLDPGPVRLVINHTGYQLVERRVPVPVGQAVTVNFTLYNVPVPTAYIDDTYQRSGTLHCMARANASPANTNTNPSCSDMAPDHTGGALPPGRTSNLSLLPEAGGILIEVRWQQSVPTNLRLRVAIRVSETDTWRQYEGQSVLRIPLREAELALLNQFAGKDYRKEGGQLFFLVYPGETVNQAGVGGAGATFMQDYTIYVTVFYRQPLADGYTRLAP